ncbi:MAG: hypothetical protein AAF518_07375 [Spirochaetota bacterium]
MKKKFRWVIFITLSLSVCNSGKEVLATFQGGSVTRQELRDFYKFKDAPINPKTTSLKNQLAVLEGIALQKIIYKENEKAKIFAGKEFTNIWEIAEKQMLADLYRKEYQKNLSSEEKLKLVSIQFLFLKANKGEDLSSQAENHKKALAALSDDKAIYKYMAENTQENGRKPVGGFLEPFCVNCGPNPLLDTFTEGIRGKSKDFFVSSDKFANAYIYRVVERQEVTSDSLVAFLKERFLKFQAQASAFDKDAKSKKEKQYATYYMESGAKLDKKVKLTAEHYQKQFAKIAWTKHLQEISKTNAMSVNSEIRQKRSSIAVGDLQDDTVLYTFKSKPFTYKELNQEFDKLRVQGEAEADNPRIIREKLNFLYEIYIPGVLFSTLEAAKKIRGSDAYKLAETFLRRGISWSFFQNNLQKQKIEIKEEEIKETYEAGKMYSYVDTNIKDKKVPLPYGQVKERIRRELTQNKTRKLFENQIAGLKKQYALKVDNKKLKEGKL